MATVLIAMSGGVDSSAAAALLLDAGHDVTGVHLKMADTPSGLPGKGCCTLDDARDAQRVGHTLGIDVLVWDLSAAFAERVVDDFVDSYASGQTPNPCIRCNERVKYRALLGRARAVGFDALATGHHARVVRDDGGWSLRRATDPDKDQTYVLYMATQDELGHTLLPAGEHTKPRLRAIAADLGLTTAAKPDSHDVCFIPSGDLGAFLRPRLGERAGAIVDADGTHLADHDGAYRFTIGQRRGLGLSGLDEPRYVAAIDGSTVTVGRHADLAVAGVHGVDASWVAGAPPVDDGSLTAQVRYRSDPLPCRVEAGGGEIVIRFDGPQPHGVAPGQAVVVYRGEACLGGATVDRVVPAS